MILVILIIFTTTIILVELLIKRALVRAILIAVLYCSSCFVTVKMSFSAARAACDHRDKTIVLELLRKIQQIDVGHGDISHGDETSAHNLTDLRRSIASSKQWRLEILQFVNSINNIDKISIDEY